MTKPPEPVRCVRCKVPLTGSIFHLSEEHDPLRVITLCHRCAIIACFRVGRVGKR